jgi:hypothetical protein
MSRDVSVFEPTTAHDGRVCPRRLGCTVRRKHDGSDLDRADTAGIWERGTARAILYCTSTNTE